MKKGLIFCLILFGCISTQLYSVPAYTKKVKVRLTDGDSTFIFIRGDETRKWAVSEDDYTLLPSGDGWSYAQEDADGYACASPFLLSAKPENDSSFRHFITDLKKNIPVRKSVESATVQRRTLSFSDETPMTGVRSALVILMEFADLPFRKTLDDFYRLFNEKGYSDDGAKGSVNDYFTWASHGQLDFICDIVGPFETQHPMAYYGGNLPMTSKDANPYELFKEAMEYATGVVNLAEYDSNDDGCVDNVHIIFSGYGEEAGAPSSAIWSHEMTFHPLIYQDMIVERYSCAPELRGNSGNGISRIGVHCHEMGHVLGAMDYYDTDYETGGAYAGTGVWDIMADGCWNDGGVSPANFNPYVRIYDFGWEEANTLPEDALVTLEPSNVEKGNIYQIRTAVEGEFFLLENRALAGFDSALPAGGLHIYHVGAGIEDKKLSNQINATYPQECYLVCASSEYGQPIANPESYGDINSTGTPFSGVSGKNKFSDTTVPSARLQSGGESGIMLSDIQLQENGKISFYHGNLPEQEVWWHEDFEEKLALLDWDLTGDLRDYAMLYNYDLEEQQQEFIFKLKDDGNGKRCFYIENSDAISYKGSMISDWILCKDALLSDVSFQYILFSKNAVRPNALSTYYRTSRNEEWKLLGKFTENGTEWNRAEYKLPQVDSLQLTFELDVSVLGAITLDNIELRLKSSGFIPENRIPNKKEMPVVFKQVGSQLSVTPLKDIISFEVFDITGRLVAQKKSLPCSGEETITLLPGIYILSVDGCRIKYVHN